jgi:hypothetical protein
MNEIENERMNVIEIRLKNERIRLRMNLIEKDEVENKRKEKGFEGIIFERNFFYFFCFCKNKQKDALAARFLNRRFLTDEVNSRGHKMKMTLEAYFKLSLRSNLNLNLNLKF